MLDPKNFFWIVTSVAATTINFNSIKTLLADGFNTFFIKGKPVFRNGLKILPTNPPDCLILDSWVCENFVLSDELLAFISFTKTQNFVLVNNSLCGKLVSLLELPIRFHERFKVTLVPYFFSDYNILGCKLDNFTFKILYWVILY